MTDDDYIELTSPDLTHHLGPDAKPVAECDACGRQTWAKAAIGWMCGMTQPDGAKCMGIMMGSRWPKPHRLGPDFEALPHAVRALLALREASASLTWVADRFVARPFNGQHYIDDLARDVLRAQAVLAEILSADETEAYSAWKAER